MEHLSTITPRDLEHMLCDETVEPKALPLSLLEQITNGFSDEQKIGRGGFAVVYKGMLENKTVAVKRMSNTLMDEKMFHREVQSLMTAKHNNIIRFLGYCADRQGVMGKYEGKFVMADVHERLLCFEFLPKGTLLEYITDTSRKLRWRDWYTIIMGICHGLHYLHREKIVHLDLNPANILLDDNLEAKIADFGLSRCFIGENESQLMSKIGGTFGYMAPECFKGKTQVKYGHSYRLDIYSLGVVITDILTKGKEHQTVDNVVEIWSNIVEISQRDEQLKQVRVCAEIATECTNFNPAKRPDTQRIINKLVGKETMDDYINTGLVTSRQGENVPNEQHQGMPNSPKETSSKLDQNDLVFTVKDEPWSKLKKLRDLNNLHGSLMISGLEKVTSREEALDANLAAKERLTELVLEWDYKGRTCSPEVQAQVLEGLCPPVGLKKLAISCYEGSKYPDWMVGKTNGGPKDLQEFRLFTCVKGPAPQIVEAFPNLRVLWLAGGDWEALPSNMEHLTSLKKLTIGFNKNIQSLPTLPRSLEEFDAFYCHRKFMKSCKKVGHPNWQKIEHIPRKTFNDGSLGKLIVEASKFVWDLMTT